MYVDFKNKTLQENKRLLMTSDRQLMLRLLVYGKEKEINKVWYASESFFNCGVLIPNQRILCKMQIKFRNIKFGPLLC